MHQGLEAAASGSATLAGRMALKVLIVSNMFPPEVIGGAEIVAHRQALALKARGAEVTVLAGGLPRPDFPSDSFVQEDVDGLPVYRLSLRSMDTDANFHSTSAAGRLQSILSTRQPDVVHFHNVTGLGANLIPTARQFGARTVVTLHDHWGFCFKNTRLRNDGQVCQAFEECAACTPSVAVPGGGAVPMRLRRDYVSWCLAQADLLLSPSEYLAEAYAKGGFAKPSVLSNGVPCAQIPVAPKRPTQELEFAAFGYLGEHKGLLVLLRAAERLAADPDLAGRWTLTIAGQGHLEPALRAQIKADRFGGAVKFVGRLTHSDALAVIARAHVVVLASSWPENQSVTLLEAVASGTAQLASRIGGNAELVSEGESGLLFAPNDDEGLAAAMRRFIIEPGLADAYGRHNAGRRLEFDEQQTVDRLWHFLGGLGQTPLVGDEIIVICAGRDWSTEVALMVHHLHLAEDAGPRIRLIWREWVEPQHWEKAKLLWVSGDSGRQDLPSVTQALQRGMPILAPRGSACAGLVGESVTAYDTLLEALGWIAALQDVSEGPAGASASAVQGLSSGA
jgi:glycosyltransferase involved in cell wall biosynthesis